MKIVCLLHSLLKEIQEWTGDLARPLSSFLQIDLALCARTLGSSRCHLFGLRAGALLCDWRRPFNLVRFAIS